MGICCMAQETQTGALYQPRGVGWGGRQERTSKGRGYTCTYGYYQPRQHIKKQRHYFANKDPSSQGYGFSKSHVWMWELDYKGSWAPKNWCFWIVVLEKTFESPLIKGIKQEDQTNQSKGNEPWIFIGWTDAKAETPILWPPDVKCWLTGRPWCWARLRAGG